MSTLEITYNIIAPVFIIVGLTVLADRRLEIDPRGISRLVIYLLSPALLVDRLATMELTATEAGQLIALAVLVGMTLGMIAWAVAQALGYERALVSSFVLCALLTNNGNYGLPLNRFAFGEAGEERALLYFVGSVGISNTLGVFIASRGNGSTRQALVNVLTVPLPYAAAVGLALNFTGSSLPTPLERSIGLLGDAAIPAMLVVLGLRLSRASIRGQIKPVLIVSAIKLMVAPVVGLLLAMLLGLSGLTRQVGITQSSMPTAVMASILATEFGSESEVVTGTIVVTTLASMVTLSILLSLLM
jgi:hypothetical protein